MLAFFTSKLGLQLLIGVAMTIGGAYLGYQLNDNIWSAKYAEQQKVAAQLQVKVKELEIKSETVTTKVVTEYVDRIKIVRDKADSVIREVPVYVTQKSDGMCVIPTGFVWHHNAAATNSDLPGTTGSANEEATGVKLSEVEATVASNYAKYHEVTTQLESLQQWVLEQRNTINK